MEVATHFKIKPVKLFITCTNHLHAHPWHLTHVSQHAWCKCSLRL